LAVEEPAIVVVGCSIGMDLEPEAPVEVLVDILTEVVEGILAVVLDRMELDMVAMDVDRHEEDSHRVAVVVTWMIREELHSLVVL